MLRLEQPGNLRRLLLWDFKKRPVKLSLEGFASKGGCGFRMWTTAPFSGKKAMQKGRFWRPFFPSVRAESLADDLAGIGDKHEGVGIDLLAFLTQPHRLTPADSGKHHLSVLMGISTLPIQHSGAAL